VETVFIRLKLHRLLRINGRLEEIVPAKSLEAFVTDIKAAAERTGCLSGRSLTSGKKAAFVCCCKRLFISR